MPRREKNLPVARAKNRPPVAPADLWEILDTERKAHIPPTGAFTIADYAARYGVTVMISMRAVNKLVNAGRLIEVGRFGSRNARHFVLRRNCRPA